jgi:hypothetical protein
VQRRNGLLACPDTPPHLEGRPIRLRRNRHASRLTKKLDDLALSHNGHRTRIPVHLHLAIDQPAIGRIRRL